MVLGLAVDVAVKAAVLGLSPLSAGPARVLALRRQGDGCPAILYPATTLLIPAIWWQAGRPEPYPFLADIAAGLPFVLDAAGNVFGLFAIKGFDVLPHSAGWFFLSIAFGLAVAPLAGEPWLAFGLVVGFGAVVDILWEVGEFLLMRSGASGLQLTYENTIQDLVSSLVGAALGAVVVATVLWPAAGTPATPFGWR